MYKRYKRRARNPYAKRKPRRNFRAKRWKFSKSTRSRAFKKKLSRKCKYHPDNTAGRNYKIYATSFRNPACVPGQGHSAIALRLWKDSTAPEGDGLSTFLRPMEIINSALFEQYEEYRVRGVKISCKHYDQNYFLEPITYNWTPIQWADSAVPEIFFYGWGTRQNPCTYWSDLLDYQRERKFTSRQTSFSAGCPRRNTGQKVYISWPHLLCKRICDTISWRNYIGKGGWIKTALNSIVFPLQSEVFHFGFKLSDEVPATSLGQYWGEFVIKWYVDWRGTKNAGVKMGKEIDDQRLAIEEEEDKEDEELENAVHTMLSETKSTLSKQLGALTIDKSKVKKAIATKTKH